jgi:hypothetical protein
VSEPTKPSWDDLSAFLTPMQIARLRMLESASEFTGEPTRKSLLSTTPVYCGIIS